MFEPKIILKNIYYTYNYECNDIKTILKYFLNGEFIINIPENYDELQKIKLNKTKIDITGESKNASMEYIPNPNYSNSCFEKPGYNLITILEQGSADYVLKTFMKIYNKDTAGDSSIQIIEKGDNDDIFYTRIVLHQKFSSIDGLGTVSTSYFNSDTLNHFREHILDFDAYNHLPDVGIYKDDSLSKSLVKVEEGDTSSNMEKALIAYEENIRKIKERNKSARLTLI